jgi:hypothetical protein
LVVAQPFRAAGIDRSAALQGCPAFGRPKTLRHKRPPLVLQCALQTAMASFTAEGQKENLFAGEAKRRIVTSAFDAHFD